MLTVLIFRVCGCLTDFQKRKMSTQVSNKFKNLIFIFSSDSVIWFVTVFLLFQYSILFKQEHGEFLKFYFRIPNSSQYIASFTTHSPIGTNLKKTIKQ